MFEDFKKEFKYKLQKIKLSELCTLKIGGYTDLFFEAGTIEKLTYAVKQAKKFNVPYLLLGCGSNIFFSDEGFDGLIIKNSIEKNINLKKKVLNVSSSVTVKELTNYFIDNEITGLEFMSGIPGSIGGAVYMNAGAFGENIGEHLVSARIMDSEGNIIEVDNDYFLFDYRSSILKKKKEIVLDITLKYTTGNKNLIKNKVEEILELRRQKHPGPEAKTAGSYFKNVLLKNGERRTAAGYLLDKAGAKGIRIGDAAVSEKHANFLINTGNAKSDDILSLAKILKEKVKAKFNIELEEEVIYIPKSIGE